MHEFLGCVVIGLSFGIFITIGAYFITGDKVTLMGFIKSIIMACFYGGIVSIAYAILIGGFWLGGHLIAGG